MIELVKRKTIGEESGEIAVFFDGTEELHRKDRRAHERSIVKQCLEVLLDTGDVEVSHAESGAPFLAHHPELELSLSHSKNWYVFQVSTAKNVGIDIQVFRKDGLHKGRSYFINDQEEKMIELTDKNLHLIWSAKEAIYKFRKGAVELYKESITVVNIEGNRIFAEVDGKALECGFEITEDYVLVYTV